MSSQTTDTPGTTTTRKPCRNSLRSNFTNLPDTRTQSKSTILIANHIQEPAPPKNQHTTKANHFQAVQQGVWPQSFRISGGDSENNTRPPTPTANPRSAGSANLNSASLLGSTAITCQCGTSSVEKHFYGVAHIARRQSVSGRGPLEQQKGMWRGGPWTVPRMGHQRLVPGITDHCLDLK